MREEWCGGRRQAGFVLVTREARLHVLKSHYGLTRGQTPRSVLLDCFSGHIKMILSILHFDNHGKQTMADWEI